MKLRLHVYICKVCGTGKVNTQTDESGVDWTQTYHRPDGTSVVQRFVPACEVGPRTPEFLAKYATEIAAWRGHRHAINMTPGG